MSLTRDGGDPSEWIGRWLGVPSRLLGQWMPEVPMIEIEERTDAVVARAEVPGVAPEDLEVVVKEATLTVRGEFREDAEGHGSVRRRGRFTRTVSLPAEVRPDASDAVCRHGVLRVTMPKARQGSDGHTVQVRFDEGPRPN